MSRGAFQSWPTPGPSLHKFQSNWSGCGCSLGFFFLSSPGESNAQPVLSGTPCHLCLVRPGRTFTHTHLQTHSSQGLAPWLAVPVLHLSGIGPSQAGSCPEGFVNKYLLMQRSPVFTSGHKHILTQPHNFLNSWSGLWFPDNILDGRTCSWLALTYSPHGWGWNLTFSGLLPGPRRAGIEHFFALSTWPPDCPPGRSQPSELFQPPLPSHSSSPILATYFSDRELDEKLNIKQQGRKESGIS